MGAKAVRQALAAQLETVDGLRVVGFADDITPEPTSAVGVLWVNQVGPVEVMPTSLLAYDCRLVIAVAKQEPGTSDDELDDVLDLVLGVLDAADELLWTSAVRGVYLDAYPCYTITIGVRAA